jgi:hypothetical protein
MPRLRVDREMLEGISVEWLDAESIDGTLIAAKTNWSRLRKAAPFNRLLPFTLVWAKDLPPQVRPEALMDKFPRIANLVATNWNEPAAFRAYLQSLLVDGRRGRQGFASEVKEELDTLRMFYDFGSCRRTTGAERAVSPFSPPTPVVSVSHPYEG